MRRSTNPAIPGGKSLTPHETRILAVLATADAPIGITTVKNTLANHGVTPNGATIHRALARFHTANMVKRHWATPDDARPYREFELTDTGRRVADAVAGGADR